MKLKKFRLINYKSIRDSGYCWLSSDITTLAGKNESGKTAILESLRDFDTDVETIPDEALPLDDCGEPELEFCFEVEKTILDEVQEETGIKFGKSARDLIMKKGLTIFKFHDGRYCLDEDVRTFLDSEIDKANNSLIVTMNKLVTQLHQTEGLSGIVVPEINDEIDTTQQAISQYLGQIRASLPSVSEEEQATAGVRVDQLETASSSLQDACPSKEFLDEVVQHVPKFIFFSDFLDILPFELSFDEAKANKTVQDFAVVAGLDLDKVTETTDTQRRRNILSQHSATISGDFLEYWGQDKLDLVAEPDGDKLRLGVKESNKTILFKPEQRSKGFQWFLSFYLRLNAKRDDTNIILIDEPGLYLHAKAQKDVLKVLEKISQESQIVFSTHSPYLIDVARLDRIRLVLNDGRNGTRIENKVHRDADTETLTPIITAIGLDITHEFSVAGKSNVLLEGISDYYYLRALISHVPECKGGVLNLIPCVGAPKMPQLASLLIGWDLRFTAVLDHDGEGMRVAKVLRDKLAVPSDDVIFVSTEKDFCIEDLFTVEDFNNHILTDDDKSDGSISNSKFLKGHRLDKVLLAKKFFEEMNSTKSQRELSSDSIRNFKEVLSKIRQNVSSPKRH